MPTTKKTRGHVPMGYASLECVPVVLRIHQKNRACSSRRRRWWALRGSSARGADPRAGAWFCTAPRPAGHHGVAYRSIKASQTRWRRDDGEKQLEKVEWSNREGDLRC